MTDDQAKFLAQADGDPLEPSTSGRLTTLGWARRPLLNVHGNVRHVDWILHEWETRQRMRDAMHRIRPAF